MTEINTATVETSVAVAAKPARTEAEKAAFRKGFGQEIARQKKAEARNKALRQYYGQKKGAEARAAARQRHIGAWAAKKAAERQAAKA